MVMLIVFGLSDRRAIVALPAQVLREQKLQTAFNY